MTFLRALLGFKLAGEKALSPGSAASAPASPFALSSADSKRPRACAVPNRDGERAAVKGVVQGCENVPLCAPYFVAVGSNVGGRHLRRDWANHADPPRRKDGHPHWVRRLNASSETSSPRSVFLATRCEKTVSCTARSARKRESTYGETNGDIVAPRFELEDASAASLRGVVGVTSSGVACVASTS